VRLALSSTISQYLLITSTGYNYFQQDAPVMKLTLDGVLAHATAAEWVIIWQKHALPP